MVFMKLKKHTSIDPLKYDLKFSLLSRILLSKIYPTMITGNVSNDKFYLAIPGAGLRMRMINHGV